ncbi:MAG: DNA mismatch repair endonuclease MutL [Bacteroidota bacterium]
MESVIQLLPDAIANQIAAGEVVQRPASVVKELLENAVDAGASKVDLSIKDAGKTLIQVCDNGCGMSARDARVAFERHATSKIRNEEDLFSIRTLGFRGEALPSIAAVAQVQLKTRLHDAEIGHEIRIEGGSVSHSGPVATLAGSIFTVKNLFFNVPARRNFLKSNSVETRHILNEFIRVALARTHIHFSFRHNDTLIYDLAPSELPARMQAFFGKDLKNALTYVEESSGYVTLSGVIGAPSLYRKNRNETFFFVNRRFIKSNYLHHAVMKGYDQVIPKDKYPVYALFLEIDPVHVDINIHPTKTKVKFDDERTIYVLLQGLVKTGLGGLHQTPAFDLTDPDLKEAIYNSSPPMKDTSSPTIGEVRKTFTSAASPGVSTSPKDWDALYKPVAPPEVPKPAKPSGLPSLFSEEKSLEKARPSLSPPAFIEQLNHKYLVTAIEGELILIHQRRAHQRILYERFLQARSGPPVPSQQLLFPQSFEYSSVDFLALKDSVSTLARMGFEIKDFGENTVIVYGVPSGVPTSRLKDILSEAISEVQQAPTSLLHEKLFEGLARSVAKRSAISSSQELSRQEMTVLLRDLRNCKVPGFAPSGKPIMKKLGQAELAQFFGK